MNDAWGWWLFFVGLGVGVAVYWLLAGRIRRTEDDLAQDEQAAEAAWISATITQGGGEVPNELVAQIIELHRRYLDGDGPTLAPNDVEDAPAPEEQGPASAEASVRDDPDMEGDHPQGEAPEAHLGQPG